MPVSRRDCYSDKGVVSPKKGLKVQMPVSRRGCYSDKGVVSPKKGLKVQMRGVNSPRKELVFLVGALHSHAYKMVLVKSKPLLRPPFKPQ